MTCSCLQKGIIKEAIVWLEESWIKIRQWLDVVSETSNNCSCHQRINRLSGAKHPDPLSCMWPSLQHVNIFPLSLCSYWQESRGESFCFLFRSHRILSEMTRCQSCFIQFHPCPRAKREPVQIETLARQLHLTQDRSRRKEKHKDEMLALADVQCSFF